ncbi:MAG TPA: hypothetical protein VL362_03460 [Patescibacteria group bacterium]|jgi:hypothetical protein|nr:hypothetical protein [Patescibacteria group bacterium]
MTNPITTDAPRLRLVLSISLVLLIGIGGAVMVFGLNYLYDYAGTVNKVVIDADASSDRIAQTKRDITEYKQDTKAVRLAEQVVASRESYQYQDNAYSDLLAMANRAGVSIEQYSFSENDPGLGNRAVPKASGTAATGAAAAQAGGLKSSYITITLTNPVNYLKFLNFLHYIEQNLTKMQIKKVSLSSASGKGAENAVITDSLTVEVYTK